MRICRLILPVLLFALSSFSFARVNIKDVKFKTQKNTGKITIEYSGSLHDYPEMQIIGKTIQVLIPNSRMKKNVERSFSFSSFKKDTKLTANQISPKESKIKAVFPFSLTKRKDKVALTIRDNKIELTFPRIKTKTAVAKKKTVAKKTKVKKEFLNEAYLNSLIKIDKNKQVKKVKPAKTALPQKSVAKKSPFKSDKVMTTLAAPSKPAPKSSISLIEYGGKFIAFLGVVLLLFYGVVTLMKKGFIKKGKLGFLNNTEQVVVLNTTYIAPKKSLMLIKAHKQVFLVSNTDSGIHPISEINDVAGLIKDGEKSISGQNFDTNFTASTEDDSVETRIKLKEDITKSNQESSLTDYIKVKDKVKFSDQIKKKVKDLKPLQ